MPSDPGTVPLNDGDVVLMVGTTKGAFLFHSDGSRASWSREGPYFAGEEVYALALDQREGRRTLWAAPYSAFYGCSLRKSEDGGATWSEGEDRPIRFPEGSDLSVKRVWQIHAGPALEPNRMLLGIEPSCLFESTDAGDTWAPVHGFMEHEHRPEWTPGAGGMCLHTIVPDPTDPDRILVAISTGGVYRTEDGGDTWKARNQGVRAEFLPDKHPEFGQCVHKVVHHAGQPERLYLQNHWGLYRSDDWGDSWTDIANGVPSDFGFAMAAHPHEAGTVFIVPIESDQFRCCPDARLRVYRTTDAGESWQPLTRGLPQEDAYETVLRDALDTDAANPAGVYFGTRSGCVYGSPDGGDTWAPLADGLPPVVCVKAAAVGWA